MKSAEVFAEQTNPGDSEAKRTFLLLFHGLPLFALVYASLGGLVKEKVQTIHLTRSLRTLYLRGDEQWLMTTSVCSREDDDVWWCADGGVCAIRGRFALAGCLESGEAVGGGVLRGTRRRRSGEKGSGRRVVR